GPIPDGTRLRCGYHVSRFENVAIASGQGIILLPLQFEVLRENSWGGLGVCNLCLCVDWIERAQRLGALSRVSGQSRLPENSGARRSEEHTSELQSLRHLVCRLLLEKKNK